MANTFTSDIFTGGCLPFGGLHSKSLVIMTGVLAVDTPAGAAADDFPASLFGLHKIVACLGIVPDGETAVIPGCPDYTMDSLITYSPSSAAVTTAETVEDELVYTTTVTNTASAKDLAADNYRVTLIGY